MHLTRLRPIEPGDLAAIRQVRGDWAIARETIGRPFPVTPANEHDWYMSLGRGRFPDSAVWAVIDGDDALVGLVQLTDIDWVHRTAWFGIWIAPEAQGKGHGKRATGEALDRAHRRLNIRQVRLNVAADNEPARSIYASAGWVEEGCLAGAVVEGTATRDLIVMRHEIA